MRYCVVGAGAIGAYVAASLARAGADVAVVARGPHLAAMQERGISVRSERGDFRATVRASADCASIGAVDVVVIALKAHQIAAMLPAIATLQGRDTRVMGMQNGIPWWYFQRLQGPYEDHVLGTVDPGGALARAFDADRVVGCVTYSATEIEAPGVIRHVEGTRYSLGRPDGAPDPVLDVIAADFVAGGLKAPVERNLRTEVWIKLLGNASLNPISALTRATLAAMTRDALVEDLIREMMTECVAVAGALGVELPISVEKRLDGARRVGEHKTSMLQDVEAGRPLELDPVVGAVVELGELTRVPVPATRHVYALARLLDRTLAAAQSAPPR
ncbi:MAG: 2-dehydropantoate 2-reductase [Candidatus Eremiobacteraeota bacterium]|nr:2-dehydropantoate 2-reductase [Candidatus Eremiobacteraeota bacterium]